MAKKKPLSRHERATLEALLVWKLAKLQTLDPIAFKRITKRITRSAGKAFP